MFYQENLELVFFQIIYGLAFYLLYKGLIKFKYGKGTWLGHFLIYLIVIFYLLIEAINIPETGSGGTGFVIGMYSIFIPLILIGLLMFSLFICLFLGRKKTN